MNTAKVMAAIARCDVISTLANCHKQGVYSLVLRERTNDYHGMIRVFYAAKGHKLGSLIDGGDFALLPHNHRQDIELVGLWGRVINVSFPEIGKHGRGLPTFKYEFSSAIVDGQLGVTNVGPERLNELQESRLSGTAALALKSHQVHTVVVESETAAWVVYEGALASHPSLCWSFKKDLSLSSEGLYVPQSQEQIKAICEQMIQEAK